MDESEATHYLGIRKENFARMNFLLNNKDLLYKNADLNTDPIKQQITTLEGKICDVS